MRRAAILPILLVLAACSSFASQRVRQYNFAIEEAAKQLTIYADADRLDGEQATAILAALKVATAQVDRYWEAVKNDAPRSIRSAIMDAIVAALNEANKILMAKETAK